MSKALEGRVEDLERELETVLGICSGLTVALTALVATHHRPDVLQGRLLAITEVADAGILGSVMSLRQREAGRSVLELLQRIEAAPPRTAPPG